MIFSIEPKPRSTTHPLPSPTPVLTFSTMPSTLHHPLPTWKRTIDLLCCAVALPLFALVSLIMSVVIRASSPGPLLFTQERVGLNGRRFRIFKFRTMHVGADTKGHQQHFAQLMQTNAPMQKLDHRGDSRMIAGAWLLRSTGLDELPQIVNVLRGEMSIVGPRPCIPYEYEQYTSQQRERCRSVPGLTGLWQVSGKNRTTFEQMIRFDCDYGTRKSLGLDLKIIALTPVALATQVLDHLKGRRAAATAQKAPGAMSSNPFASSPTIEHAGARN